MLKTKNRKTLTVTISRELVTLLYRVAERNNTTVVGELKKAIQDRAYFNKKISEGYEVVLHRGEERIVVDLS